MSSPPGNADPVSDLDNESLADDVLRKGVRSILDFGIHSLAAGLTLAAAVYLIDSGLAVELVEADEVFGGRASSWLNKDADQIEYALPVFISCYIKLMDFYKKVGVYDRLSWTKPVLLMCQDGGDQAFMKYFDLPDPLLRAAGPLNVMKNYRGVPEWHSHFSGIYLAAIFGKSPKGMDVLDSRLWAEWVYRRGPKGALDFLKGGLRGLTFTEP